MDPIPLPRDFRDFLNLLHAHGLRYLLIGGWAVGYHGYPRNTGDIDIWISTDRKNAEAAAAMIQAFIGAKVPPESFMQPSYILRMGNPPNRVEISTHIDGVDFESCYKRRITAKIEGIQVDLISLPDLLTNKKAAARLKDLQDVEELERTQKLAKNGTRNASKKSTPKRRRKK